MSNRLSHPILHTIKINKITFTYSTNIYWGHNMCQALCSDRSWFRNERKREEGKTKLACACSTPLGKLVSRKKYVIMRYFSWDLNYERSLALKESTCAWSVFIRSDRRCKILALCCALYVIYIFIYMYTYILHMLSRFLNTEICIYSIWL